MPPIDEAGLAAAVDAGIADANGPAPSAPTPTPPENSNAQETVGAADDSAGDAGAQGADEGGSAGEGSGSALPTDAVAAASDAGDGAESDSAGTEPPVAADKGKAAGEDAPPVAPAKEPDPINDPLPNALKKETKERIHKLIEMTKDGQQAKADRDQLVSMITATGANPAQFNQALDYLRMVNSPSRADREKALEVMQAEISVLARSLGKPVPGVNFLEGHNDLIQEVGGGRLSMERATEIAAARERAKLEMQGSQRMTAQTDAQRAHTEAVNAGRAGLTALEAQLAADPNYAAKKAILVPALQETFKHVDPRQWPRLFKEAYDRLPAPVRPIPPTPTQSPSGANAGAGNTPLRAANPAGGTPRAAPKNLAEAIDFGIQDAR